MPGPLELVRDGCEPPCECWEPSPGLLLEAREVSDVSVLQIWRHLDYIHNDISWG